MPVTTATVEDHETPEPGHLACGRPLQMTLSEVVLDRLAVTRPHAVSVIRRARATATVCGSPGRSRLTFDAPGADQSPEFDRQVDTDSAAIVESTDDMRRILGLK